MSIYYAHNNKINADRLITNSLSDPTKITINRTSYKANTPDTPLSTAYGYDTNVYNGTKFGLIFALYNKIFKG